VKLVVGAEPQVAVTQEKIFSVGLLGDGIVLGRHVDGPYRRKAELVAGGCPRIPADHARNRERGFHLQPGGGLE